MTFSIRWKLIVSIILPLLLIAGVVMGLTLRRLYDSAVSTLQEQHQREINLLASGIDSELAALAASVDDTARFLALQPTLDTSAVYRLLEDMMTRNQLIHGAGVAFEPFAWRDDTRLFAPYVYDIDHKRVDLSSVLGDYTNGRTPWYQGTRMSRDPSWSEPTFDSGTGSRAIVSY